MFKKKGPPTDPEEQDDIEPDEDDNPTVPEKKGKDFAKKSETPPKKSPRHAMPGEAATSHRKPVPRGHPFQHDSVLGKWSAR